MSLKHRREPHQITLWEPVTSPTAEEAENAQQTLERENWIWKENDGPVKLQWLVEHTQIAEFPAVLALWRHGFVLADAYQALIFGGE